MFIYMCTHNKDTHAHTHAHIHTSIACSIHTTEIKIATNSIFQLS